MSGRFSRSIYVGNLPGDIREHEIEDIFYKVSFWLFVWFSYGSSLESLSL